jgi:chemotaxis protein CheZ
MASRMASDAAALIEPIRNAKQAYSNSGVAELLSRVEAYLSNARRDGDVVRANLDEVLMAQSYQDLSGQIIRTVIKLVVELERTLAHFSELAGETPSVKKQENTSHGFGPAVPGVTTDAVGEQEDVDALLARMGM